MAYELLTGKPPFVGNAAQVIAAHFSETPRRVTELRPEVAAAVDRLIASCLEKEPSRRPQSADDLLLALDGYAPRRSRRSTLAISASMVVAVAAAALAYYVFRPNEPPAAGGPASNVPLTLAAIPFRNLSRDSTLEYSAEGINDEILTALGKVSGIQIVGRNAGHRYKGGDIDELAVQRELGAVFLITGTYQARDGRITVSAQISDSITHGELWSDTFVASTDWRWLPDTIARLVAGKLQARYAGRIRQPKWGAISVARVSLEAWQDYQGGQFFFKRRKLKESVERFEAALRLEPSFARAHGALALAFTLSGVFLDPPPTKVRDSVLNTARRALDLDSTVADAHAAIAMVSTWDSAKTHFRHALELDPDNFEIHLTFGRVATLRGDLPEARQQLEQAKRQDPLSPQVFAWSSYGHFLNGETDLAQKESERAFHLDSTAAAVTNLGALLYVELGDTSQARRLVGLQRLGNPTTTAPYVYAKLHDTATALRLVTEMESNNARRSVAEVQRATVMIAIDDTARALSALEESGTLSPNPFRGIIPPCDPAWDKVRQTPRFRALVRQARQDTLRLTVPGGCRR